MSKKVNPDCFLSSYQANRPSPSILPTVARADLLQAIDQPYALRADELDGVAGYLEQHDRPRAAKIARELLDEEPTPSRIKAVIKSLDRERVMGQGSVDTCFMGLCSQ